MGLRLLLVGVVASLGFDLPTFQQVREWGHAGQLWLLGTLDDWNTWSPCCDEMCAIDALSAPPAPAQNPADGQFRAVVDQMVQQFAAEGATPTTTLTSTPFTLACCCGSKLGERTAPLLAALSVGSIGLAQAAPEPAHGCAHCTEPGELQPALTWEPVAGYGAATAEAPGSPTERPAPTPSFEPFEVPQDLYQGIAYELNAENDGLRPPAGVGPIAAPAPAPAVAPTPLADVQMTEVAAAPGRGLANALRLTGEAIEAWAHLLQGPAVVSLHP